MKKILFSAYSLGLGGIETSLITLLNKLIEQYDITLVLEKKEGIFLDKIDSRIHIIEYCPNDSKIVILRKSVNLIKQIKFKLKYKNKFDFAAAYATYSLSNGFVAREASRNSAIWIHADYLSLNNNDEEITKKYYMELKCKEFKKIIFVSNESRDNFIKLFPEQRDKTIYCNNLIDGETIIEKSKQDIQEKELKDIKETIFVNIGRHDERQKKLTRLIKAAKMLKEDGFEFKILFIGDGQDSNLYKKLVNSEKLEDKIFFLGKKQNPYPYYKLSNATILTSDYEGYPVVFFESMILKNPIITTNVSDYNEIEGKYGIVTTKEEKDIYEKMRNFIQNGFELKEDFNYKEYNKKVLEKINDIINS